MKAVVGDSGIIENWEKWVGENGNTLLENKVEEDCCELVVVKRNMDSQKTTSWEINTVFVDKLSTL